MSRIQFFGGQVLDLTRDGDSLTLRYGIAHENSVFWFTPKLAMTTEEHEGLTAQGATWTREWELHGQRHSLTLRNTGRRLDVAFTSEEHFGAWAKLGTGS